MYIRRTHVVQIFASIRLSETICDIVFGSYRSEFTDLFMFIDFSGSTNIEDEFLLICAGSIASYDEKEIDERQ